MAYGSARTSSIMAVLPWVAASLLSVGHGCRSGEPGEPWPDSGPGPAAVPLDRFANEAADDGRARAARGERAPGARLDDRALAEMSADRALGSDPVVPPAPAPDSPIELGQAIALRRHLLALDNPPVVAARDAPHMRPDDVVVGVVLNGQARAYPWWVLRAYHTVNDFLADRPIFLTFCEACSGAGAFYPIVDRRVLDFGYAGDRYGCFSLHDLDTHSTWAPLAGFALDGPLAGTALVGVPTYFATWAEWKQVRPDTAVVLASEEVRRRPHGRGSTFGDQASSPWFERTLRTFDPRLPEHSLVYSFTSRPGARPRSYPLPTLQRLRLVEDDHAGEPLVLLVGGRARVSAYSRRLDDRVLHFVLAAADPPLLRDQDGTIWDEWGVATTGPSRGRSLRFAGGHVTKWGVWVNAFPDTEIRDSALLRATWQRAGACGSASDAAEDRLDVTVDGRRVAFPRRAYRVRSTDPLQIALPSADGALELGLVLPNRMSAHCPQTFALGEPTGAAPVLTLSPRDGPEGLHASSDPRAKGQLTIDAFRYDRDHIELTAECLGCSMPARRGGIVAELAFHLRVRASLGHP
ncbi:MAG TPA: DUF3179 domain-containing (seleno)protein [Kofleriaceae bacterium]|nr:DUF3179 domain-containing (seleno)protein [Kofleriaceae bacterium]